MTSTTRKPPLGYRLPHAQKACDPAIGGEIPQLVLPRRQLRTISSYSPASGRTDESTQPYLFSLCGSTSALGQVSCAACGCRVKTRRLRRPVEGGLCSRVRWPWKRSTKRSSGSPARPTDGRVTRLSCWAPFQMDAAHVPHDEVSHGPPWRKWTGRKPEATTTTRRRAILSMMRRRTPSTAVGRPQDGRRRCTRKAKDILRREGWRCAGAHPHVRGEDMARSSDGKQLSRSCSARQRVGGSSAPLADGITAVPGGRTYLTDENTKSLAFVRGSRPLKCRVRSTAGAARGIGDGGAADRLAAALQVGLIGA